MQSAGEGSLWPPIRDCVGRTWGENAFWAKLWLMTCWKGYIEISNPISIFTCLMLKAGTLGTEKWACIWVKILANWVTTVNMPPAVSFPPRGRANAMCDTNNVGHTSSISIQSNTTSFHYSVSWWLNSPSLSEERASVLVETWWYGVENESFVKPIQRWGEKNGQKILPASFNLLDCSILFSSACINTFGLIHQ